MRLKRRKSPKVVSRVHEKDDVHISFRNQANVWCVQTSRSQQPGREGVVGLEGAGGKVCDSVYWPSVARDADDYSANQEMGEYRLAHFTFFVDCAAFLWIHVCKEPFPFPVW